MPTMPGQPSRTAVLRAGDPRFAPRPVEHEHDKACPECNGSAVIKLRTDGRLFDPTTDDPNQPLNLICPACRWAYPAQVPGVTSPPPRL